MKLKLAMEEINKEPAAEVVSDGIESDAELIDLDQSLERAIHSLDEFDDFDENIDDTIQGLESLYVAVENILESDAATKETAELIHYGLETHLTRYGLSVESISLESFGDDYRAYHEASLETIRDNINRFAQSIVVPFQRLADTVQDAFKDHGVIIQRVRGVYDRAEKLFDEKKKKGFKYDTFLGSLQGFVDVYVTDRGFVRKLPEAMRKDLGMAQYVLTDYTKEMLAYADKLAGVLKSGDARSDQKFESTVLSKISSFKHPADLFNRSYLSKGEPYLYSTGIKRVNRKQAKVVKGKSGDKAYEKLAELATKDRITHFSKKLARDALKIIVAALVRTVSRDRVNAEGILFEDAPIIELTEPEIRDLFKYGRQYLDLVEKFNNQGRQFELISTKLKDAMVSLETSATDALGTANRAALRQVQTWAQITHTAMSRVSLREARRSLLVTRATSRLMGRIAANAR